MHNPYKDGVDIEVVHPITKAKKVYRNTVKSGGALEFLDNPTDKTQMGEVDTYNNVIFFPEDSFSDLRTKLYLITNIPPYRQHIIYHTDTSDNELTYEILVGDTMIDIDIMHDAEIQTPDRILDFPADKRMVNAKDDIYVDMLENSITLSIYPIKKITIVDMFDIVDPNSADVINILKNPLYEKILFYSIILKYYPIVPYDAFVSIYKKREGLSLIYEYLEPDKAQLYLKYQAESKIMINLYDNIKLIEQKYGQPLVEVMSAELETQIPYLDIRTFFDMIALGDTYKLAGMVMDVDNERYVVEKEYIHNDTKVTYDKNKPDSIVIVTADGHRLEFYGDRCRIYVEFNTYTAMEVSKTITMTGKLLQPCIDSIIKNYELVVKSGYSHIKELDISIVTSILRMKIPEKMDYTMYEGFIKYIKDLGNSNVVEFKSPGNRLFTMTIIKGSSYSMLRPENNDNGFSYYTDSDIHRKWRQKMNKDVKIYLKTDFIGLELINIPNNEFDGIYNIVSSLIFSFIQTYQKPKVTVDTFKKVKRLQDVDPVMFDLKLFDPDTPVYAVRCQSDRQPVVYRENELERLPKEKRDKLVKFLNATDDTYVYYSCENKKYPYLSFSPQIHPLLLCVPCCKKIPPSENAIKAKFNEICLKKFEITKEELDMILSESSIEHILVYGKSIPSGRYSALPQIMQNNLLNKNMSYLVAGIEQFHTSIDIVNNICFVLSTPVDKFMEKIIKNIKDKFDYVDKNSCYIMRTYDDLKYLLQNINNEENLEISYFTQREMINWESLFMQLTYLVYGVVVLIIDNDQETNDLDLLIPDFFKSVLVKKVDSPISILIRHSNGIYPIVNINKSGEIQKIFDAKDTLVSKVLDLAVIEDVLDEIQPSSLVKFVESHKKYNISQFLVGNRGLVYACVLQYESKNIYVPVALGEVVVQTQVEFNSKQITNYDSFDRKYIYKFIEDYNKYYPSNKIVIKFNIIFENNYIGVKIGNVTTSNKFENTMYHKKYKTLNNEYPIVDIPYDILQINNAINNSKIDTVIEGADSALYMNRIYSSFLLEFSTIIKKSKNDKIRNLLLDHIGTQRKLNKKYIREILKGYIKDYNTIISISAKGIQYLKYVIMFGIFSFDNSVLDELLLLNDVEIRARLEGIMKEVVMFSNEKLKMSNIAFSCKSSQEQVHCTGKKLKISLQNFNECISILIDDIKNPLRREYIIQLTAEPFNPFLFTKKENEIINIYQI